MRAAAHLPCTEPVPLVSELQLAWGRRYRPSADGAHAAVCLPVSRRLARRTWMCLPWLGVTIADVPSTATPLAQQIWRGIHEGAHLDHLGVLARSGATAPSPAEFGTGLLVAESYAMAVEMLAAVECILAGEGQAVWQLGAGLVERATRLPGGSAATAEFADLPTLAEVYVLGPVEVLADGAAGAPCRPRSPARCAPAGSPRARPIRPPPRSDPPPPSSSNARPTALPSSATPARRCFRW